MKFTKDNAILQFVSTTCDFAALNICFLLCCIPVITIGPALTALYTVTLREAKGEHGYLIRPFFSAFRQNFKTALISWTIQFGTGAVLLFNMIFWYSGDSIVTDAIGAVMAMLLVLDIMTGLYVYPLHAEFTDRSIQTLKNAFALMLSEKTATLKLGAVLVSSAGLYYVSSPGRVLFTLIGFAFAAYCNSSVINRIFLKYE